MSQLPLLTLGRSLPLDVSTWIYPVSTTTSNLRDDALLREVIIIIAGRRPQRKFVSPSYSYFDYFDWQLHSVTMLLELFPDRIHDCPNRCEKWPFRISIAKETGFPLVGWGGAQPPLIWQEHQQEAQDAERGHLGLARVASRCLLHKESTILSCLWYS